MSCCSKLVQSLKKLVSKLGPLLAVGLLLFAGYLALIAGPGVTLGSVLGSVPWMPAALASSTIPASTAAYIALGAAVVVSPDTVSSIATGVAENVGEVAGSVIAAGVGGIVGGATGGSLSTVLGFAIVGFGLYYLLTREKKDENDSEPASETKTNKSVSSHSSDVKAVENGRLVPSGG